MTNYVALLRGVNLAGRSRLDMAKLRAIADDLELANARTYIASGNLLFSSAKTEKELRSMLEQRIKESMDKEVLVVLRSAKELELIVQENPFPTVNPKAVQAFFMNGRPPADLLSTVRNQDDERITPGVREVYVAYGEKGIGRSRLKIPAADAGTARNMNTVAKLAALAKEL